MLFSETRLGPNPDPNPYAPMFVRRGAAAALISRLALLASRGAYGVCSHSETRRVCSGVGFFTDLLGLNIKIITRRYVLLVHSLLFMFINLSYSKIPLHSGNTRKGRLLHKKYQQCSNLLALPGTGVSIVHCTRASACWIALRNTRFNVFDFRVIVTT